MEKIEKMKEEFYELEILRNLLLSTTFNGGVSGVFLPINLERLLWNIRVSEDINQK